eukprot:GDKK01075920.1.p1 GENE.GDKK01075920.1~~GDKK01075920.1.p1  ORF type:complete len:147 (+),score=15.73 GDKK01075920.1:40-441(+)
MVAQDEKTVLINILSCNLPLDQKEYLARLVISRLLQKFNHDPPPHFYDFLNYSSTRLPIPTLPSHTAPLIKLDPSTLQGWNALHLSCLIGAVSTVKLLLDVGASANERLSVSNNYESHGGNPFIFKHHLYLIN